MSKDPQEQKTPEGGDPEKRADAMSGWVWLVIFLLGAAAFVWWVWKLRR